jgi:hypothetical protein
VTIEGHCSYHIFVFSSFFHNVQKQVAKGNLGFVSLPVARQWQPREQEIKRSKASVQIMIQLGNWKEVTFSVVICVQQRNP